MKKYLLSTFKLETVCTLIICLFLVNVGAISTYAKPKKLLVVTVTKGFRHESIKVAENVIRELSNSSKDFTVDFARNDDDLVAKMNKSELKNYDGVMFANTTGELPLPDREAFIDWIKSGHAFIGIHAATDTFHNFPPFIDMIGGEFSQHGPQLSVNLLVETKKNPATRHLESSFQIFDEIYLIKNFKKNEVQVLFYLDKNPNKNDQLNFNQPGFFPIAWCKNYGKGNVFYTALGHREDVLESEAFKKHLLGGIRWALKLEK